MQDAETSVRRSQCRILFIFFTYYLAIIYLMTLLVFISPLIIDQHSEAFLPHSLSGLRRKTTGHTNIKAAVLPSRVAACFIFSRRTKPQTPINISFRSKKNKSYFGFGTIVLKVWYNRTQRLVQSYLGFGTINFLQSYNKLF